MKDFTGPDRTGSERTGRGRTGRGRHEVRHHLRVDDDAAGDHHVQGAQEVAHAPHPLLEQVADCAVDPLEELATRFSM